VTALGALQEALRDRYLLESGLGRGGMATVHLVWDVKPRPPAALKVLRPELAASLGQERFQREIRRLTGLGLGGMTSCRTASGGRPRVIGDGGTTDRCGQKRKHRRWRRRCRNEMGIEGVLDGTDAGKITRRPKRSQVLSVPYRARPVRPHCQGGPVHEPATS